MAGPVRKRYSKPGTSPGALISRETTKVKAKITLTSYSADDYEELEIESLEKSLEYIGKRDVAWISIDSSQDVELLNMIGERLSFHPLALEDVITANQRPKLEDFGDYLFITVMFPQKPEPASPISMEQINIFLGPNFVITIQDSADVFEPIHQRMKENRGRIRKMKSGYLAYALIDLVVDQYFPIMESVGDQIESIEAELQEKPSPEVVRKIREAKHDLITIRSSIWPMRELINSLHREEPKLMADETKLFVRDTYDHTIQIADIVESYRDILSEIFNVYLSVTANNTNEVMKILTIFSTIFIPLTFVAGIYGMNFEFMPELRWRPAYFILLGVMGVITIVMLRFFRKRRWL